MYAVCNTEFVSASRGLGQVPKGLHGEIFGTAEAVSSTGSVTFLMPTKSVKYYKHYDMIQETRMLSQALNRAMLHSRNLLEGVNRKKLICYLAVQLYCTLKQ